MLCAISIFKWRKHTATLADLEIIIATKYTICIKHNNYNLIFEMSEIEILLTII
jgi:hypothetical protein